jgi:hypothetical protein
MFSGVFAADRCVDAGVACFSSAVGCDDVANRCVSTDDRCVYARNRDASTIDDCAFTHVVCVFTSDACKLPGDRRVSSAVVDELAAARGELFRDDCEERAVTDEPSARVRVGADDVGAFVDCGCERAAVGCIEAAVRCAYAAVVNTVSEDGGRRGETM